MGKVYNLDLFLYFEYIFRERVLEYKEIYFFGMIYFRIFCLIRKGYRIWLV